MMLTPQSPGVGARVAARHRQGPLTVSCEPHSTYLHFTQNTGPGDCAPRMPPVSSLSPHSDRPGQAKVTSATTGAETEKS